MSINLRNEIIIGKNLLKQLQFLLLVMTNIENELDRRKFHMRKINRFTHKHDFNCI